VGIAACLAVYYARNAHVEVPQSDEEEGAGLKGSPSGRTGSGTAATSSNAGSSTAAFQQQQEQQQRRQQQLLFANAVGVVVASLVLAALHREGPYEGVVPVSLLPTLIGGLTGGSPACVCIQHRGHALFQGFVLLLDAEHRSLRRQGRT